MNNLQNRESGDTVKVKVKAWWTSKTLWFNVITLALQLVNVLTTSTIFADKVQVLEVLTLIQTVGNILLRFTTTQPLSLK